MSGAGDLRVAVETDGDRVRVVCAGEVDLLTAPSLDDALGKARALTSSTLEVDLRDVTFFDSQGVRLIATLSRWSSENDVALELATSQIVRRVLEVSGVETWRTRLV